MALKRGRKPVAQTITVLRDTIHGDDDPDVVRLNLSASEELFAQGVAKGLTQKQAAIEAGYSAQSAHVTSSKLAKKPRVAQRIRQLQRSMLHNVEVARSDHLNQLVELRELAKGKAQFSAAIKAEELRGRVLGLYIEQVVQEVVGGVGQKTLDTASTAELKTAIAEAVERLGLFKDITIDASAVTLDDDDPVSH